MDKLFSRFFKYVFLSAFFTTTKSLNNPSLIFKEKDYISIFFSVVVLSAGLPILVPIIVKCFRKDLDYCRLFSLWSYFSMIVLICFVVAMAIFSYPSEHLLPSMMNVLPPVLITSFYLCVLLEAQCCKEKNYLEYSSNNDDIDSCLNVIYESDPQITLQVECYHYVTHEYGEYSYSSNVTTHTESVKFDYKSCRDLSDRSKIPSARKNITQIKLSKVLSYRDKQTSEMFAKLGKDLVERNKNKDLYIKYYEDIEFPGFKDSVKSYNATRPFWMNKFYFQLADFLTLSWPYRWLLNRNVQQINHLIIKEISIFDYRQPSSSVPFPSI